MSYICPVVKYVLTEPIFTLLYLLLLLWLHIIILHIKIRHDKPCKKNNIGEKLDKIVNKLSENKTSSEKIIIRQQPNVPQTPTIDEMVIEADRS